MSSNASQKIDQQIAGFPDWRGELYSALRKLIHEADPEITEEWKWDTGVWSHDGLVCAVGVFKTGVKLNFFQGASIADPKKLFNAGLEAKKSRAIDFFENDTVNESSVKDLIRAAIELNVQK